MTTAADLSVADRLVQVLEHLSIERAHFAASMLADVTGFAQAHPERIASLTLVCPPRLDQSSPCAGRPAPGYCGRPGSAGGNGAPSREEPPRGYGGLAS
jgi:pimeloyl-ACP methyl ester carboxylesterase